MKILIMGAGQVGSTLAESLVSEQNDITVVDIDPRRLKDLQDRLDLRTVVGFAAHPSTLIEAGIEDTDLLIAVTQSDETNLAACKVGKMLFNVPTRIARVRSRSILARPELLTDEGFAVDYAISPEDIVTEAITRLIEFPEALQVLDFAGGRVTMVAVRAVEGGPLVGLPLKDMRKHLTNVDARVTAIFRGDQAIIPDGDTVVKAGDEVFCIADTEHIRQVMRELRKMDKPVKRLMIAGGGNIGLRLALALEKEYQVKIIEFNKVRAEHIADRLNSALVLQGDATDEELLESENIGEMDLFLSLTNDDENNIMSALLAKRMGARRVVALINRRSYADLVQGGQIDIAISPAQATIGKLLQHIRRGDVAAVHSLRRGAAEALELIAHGDEKTCKVIGKKVEDIELPRGAAIGAIVRALPRPEVVRKSDLVATERMSEVVMAHHDTIIRPDDHVIMFLANKRMIPRVEKLFQVGYSFI
ncbi:MAG TPA: Trk system potassium transporter TrkA [Burkholderiales bacterium]|nr:Trk system potassium transporter TrkA [Burkholderiales bacterium]